MKRALINVDYTYDFVAEDGKLTCGKPGQALEKKMVSLTTSLLNLEILWLLVLMPMKKVTHCILNQRYFHHIILTGHLEKRYMVILPVFMKKINIRSEERRVGKECRYMLLKHNGK